MLRLCIWVGLFLATPATVQAGDNQWPGRYANPPQNRGLALRDLWGSPEVTPAYGHTAAFSRDGKQALFASGGALDPTGASADSTLVLWDAAGALRVRELPIPKAAVTALALAPDGRHAVAGLLHIDAKGMQTHRVVLFDLTTGAVVKGYDKQPGGGIHALAFAPNGKQVLAAFGSGLVRSYHGAKTTDVLKENATALIVAFHPDGTKALAGFAGILKLWDLQTGNVVREFKGHDRTVSNAVFSTDGERLVSSGSDVRLWDVRSGKEIGVLKKEPMNNILISLAFADAGRKVLVVWTGFDAATGNQEQCTISLWDGEAQKELWSHKAKFRGVVPIFVAPGSSDAVLGGGANAFTALSLADGEESKISGGHTGSINALGATSYGTALSGGQDGMLKVWEGGKPVKTCRGHADAITALALSQDGQFLVTGSADRTIKLWDVRTGKVRKTFRGHTGTVTGVAFSSDLRWFISGSTDRTLKIWDLVTGKDLQTLAGHAEAINGITLAPDASWVASASDDSTIRVWPLDGARLDSERDPFVLEDHTRQVTCVAFSPDGKHLLSGSQDKTLKLWDVSKRQVLKTLAKHMNWVSSITFLDNDRVVSTSDDLTARLWSLSLAKEIGQVDLSAHADCPRCVARLPGAKGAFLVGTSGWVILKFAPIP